MDGARLRGVVQFGAMVGGSHACSESQCNGDFNSSAAWPPRRDGGRDDLQERLQDCSRVCPLLQQRDLASIDHVMPRDATVQYPTCKCPSRPPPPEPIASIPKSGISDNLHGMV